jgi:hypothetical protein
LPLLTAIGSEGNIRKCPCKRKEERREGGKEGGVSKLLKDLLQQEGKQT